ncbi:MAG TPA: alkaline phosphatase family protein [Rhodopila sp.]
MSLTAVTAQALAPAVAAAAPQQPNDDNTTTPIKHVVVVYGENRSFDHLFATYAPHGNETVNNLLSEGIVNADGTPGPNFAKVAQYKATDTDTYSISPTKTGAYATLPPPIAGGPEARSDTSPPFNTIAEAQDADGGVLPRDLRLLTTGATGLPAGSVDTRINNVSKLPSGPFQLTPGVPNDAYAASPVHRFYQDWQQHDCNAQYATATNPSGCLNDLFPWVETTIGAGSNGKAQPANFTDATTGEGATAMGFYNMQQGDAAYTKQLADAYTISDNYHQPGKGGSVLNDILAGFADGIWYSDGNGNPATPPANQIENPNPASGTNNWYSQDGYSGGSYSECSDTTHPGVASIAAYLNSLPTKVKLNCDPGHYYMLNNLNPGYLANGQVNTTTFTVPPVPIRSIADALLDSSVSFAYFAEGWNSAVVNGDTSGSNPFNFQTRFMTNATLRTQANKDLTDFEAGVHDGNLPAVSFVKPSGLNDGHPASSKWTIYEAFVRKIITELRQNPDLWQTTAVFVTVDEGGGYYDSGYSQNLDFFGDGVRIPLLVISPFAGGGHVSHNYADHVSILKFIEKNWGVAPISARSRDNLPNPVAAATNPYVPTNGPSISDLMDMFNFKSASAN